MQVRDKGRLPQRMGQQRPLLAEPWKPGDRFLRLGQGRQGKVAGKKFSTSRHRVLCSLRSGKEKKRENVACDEFALPKRRVRRSLGIYQVWDLTKCKLRAN